MIVATHIVHNQKVVATHLGTIRLISHRHTIKLLVCLIRVTHRRTLDLHSLSIVNLLLRPGIVLLRHTLRDVILDDDLLLAIGLLIHVASNKIVIWIAANFEILWILPVHVLKGTLVGDSLIAQSCAAHLVIATASHYLHLGFYRPALHLLVLLEKGTRWNDVRVVCLILQLVSQEVIWVSWSRSFLTWKLNGGSSPGCSTLNLELRIAHLWVTCERIKRHGTHRLLVIVV